MKTSHIVLLSLVGLFLLVGGCGVSRYNSMVNMDEAVTAQWANVETQYQRRADLIPNLVNTVKGYADFEQETLTQVIEARSKATSINIDANNLTPEKVAQFEQAQQGLSSALSRLLVTVERYPDLKANQNFLQLQNQLEGTENRIAVERKRFNDLVGSYNARIRRFPNNLIAGFGGFQAKGYFQSREGADVVPDVTF